VSTSSGTRMSSAATKPLKQTPAQVLRERAAKATQDLRDALRLPSDLSDATILGTALAEAAAQEIRRNAAFGQEVRRLYNDISQSRKPAGGAGARPKVPSEPLVALRHTGAHIDPLAPPNPKTLIYVYGEDKLPRALQDFGMDLLKEAADNIQREHPGTKPASRTRKSALIEYIVQYSTNGR
jgi:hypothetical protein